MTATSTYLKNQLYAWIKGNAFALPPATAYLALFDGDPTANGTGGEEVTAAIRPLGRVAIPFGSHAGGTMKNSAIVDFGTSAANETYTHVGLFDAQVGGNLLQFAAVNGGAQAVTIGTQVFVPVDTITVSFS